MALDVGKIFYMERDNRDCVQLTRGIGRLIYQLPVPLCEMFMKEVFPAGANRRIAFDEETLTTINKFFENSLNVSETAQPAVHPQEYAGVPAGEAPEEYGTGESPGV